MTQPRSLAWLFVLLCWVCAFVGAAQAADSGLQAIPALSARITDTTGTLSAEQKAALDSRLAELERTKGSQVAVLIVPTTQPEAIEQYSIRVAEAWKIGRKDIGDGVIVLVAKDDRKLRIEVGRGLEGAIPDAYAKRIVTETIAPHFRQGDFSGGLSAGVEAIIQLINGETLPPPPQQQHRNANQGTNASDWWAPLLIGIFVLGSFLTAAIGKMVGAGVTGGIAGMVTWLLTSSLLVGGISAFVAFVLVLLVSSSSGGGGSGGTPGGWGGGWSGGSSGDSGGGSSWSGGGGDFGGGGASGDW